MKTTLSCKRLWAIAWVRRVLVVMLAVAVYWAGTGFSMPYWMYNLTSDYDESVLQDYGKRGYGGGFAMEEAEMIAMDMADSSPSFAPTSAVLLPPSNSGTGDLSKYDDVGPRIIKTGSVSMDVKNTEETLASISVLAGSYEGFVQSSNTWLNYNDTLAGSITLRVGSEYFETAMVEIKKLATVVRSESVSGQDVTEEFIDVQARLGTLHAEEAQYLEILKKATTVEEILQVNDYLSRVRRDIESSEGRLQYLENKTVFSTISVDVSEETSVIAPTRDWQPFVVVKQALNQLVVAAQGFVNVLIWLLVFGVPVIVVGWLIRMGVKRARR